MSTYLHMYNSNGPDDIHHRPRDVPRSQAFDQSHLTSTLPGTFDQCTASHIWPVHRHLHFTSVSVIARSVFEVVLQKSIPTQICQLVFNISIIKETQTVIDSNMEITKAGACDASTYTPHPQTLNPQPSTRLSAIPYEIRLSPDQQNADSNWFGNGEQKGGGVQCSHVHPTPLSSYIKIYSVVYDSG